MVDAEAPPPPKEQARRVKDIEAQCRNTESSAGTRVMIVSNKWFSAWCKWTGFQYEPIRNIVRLTAPSASQAPGEIDNGDIVLSPRPPLPSGLPLSAAELDSLVPLRDGLVEKTHYWALAEPTWKLLVAWHGVKGPVVERRFVRTGHNLSRVELDARQVHCLVALDASEDEEMGGAGEEADAGEVSTLPSSASDDGRVSDSAALFRGRGAIPGAARASCAWALLPFTERCTGANALRQAAEVLCKSADSEEWELWEVPLERASGAWGSARRLATPFKTLISLGVSDLSVLLLRRKARAEGSAPSSPLSPLRPRLEPFSERLAIRGAGSCLGSSGGSLQLALSPTGALGCSPLSRSGGRPPAWAEDAVSSSSSRRRGLAGLGNLGNTCFMNSSLQCLAHAGPIMETFLSGAYERDLNRDNPLGLGGKLAEAFGGLMHKLWGPGASSVQPKHFKWQLSKFAPQFQGYAQQDSQELLAFLLDGLHEDLNRIREKPYVPEPEEDERESDAQRAERAWEGYRARNDSPIVDTFQGLYRSALECPDCRRTSVKFDPFMYLSLPLPAPKLRKLDVVLLDLSSAAQAVGRRGDGPRDEAQESDELQDGAVDSGELQDEAAEGDSAARPSSSFPQAVHLAVEVPSEGDVAGVKLALAAALQAKRGGAAEGVDSSNPSPEAAACARRLVLARWRAAAAGGGGSLDLMDDEESVSDIPDQEARGGGLFAPRAAPHQPSLICYLVPMSWTAPDMRSVVVHHRCGLSSPLFPTLLRFLESEMGAWSLVEAGKGTACLSPAAHDAVASVLDAVLGLEAGFGGPGAEEGEGDVAGIAASASPDSVASARSQLDAEMGEEGSCAGSVGSPALSPATAGAESMSEEEEELPVDGEDKREHKSGEGRRGPTSLFSDPSSPSSPLASCSSPLAAPVSPLALPRVTLKLASREGRPRFFYAGLEGAGDWASASPLSLAAEWRAQALTGAAGRGSWEEACAEAWAGARAGGEAPRVALADCVASFLQPERLAASESWYCGRCQAHVRASKKLDLWSLPEVLVIHLKRFSYSRYARDKLATPVDFPLRGLDLREALLPEAPQRLAAERERGSTDGRDDPSVEEQKETSTLYDLYAVSDHFGGLGGGHYTATVQMQDDGGWYVFDDTQVRPVVEEDVASPAAYVLFYKRRSCDWAGAEVAFGRGRDHGDEPSIDGQARESDPLPDDDVMAVDLDI